MQKNGFEDNQGPWRILSLAWALKSLTKIEPTKISPTSCLLIKISLKVHPTITHNYLQVLSPPVVLKTLLITPA